MTVTVPELLVFARDPGPGKVKTRLVPALSPASAAAVARQLIEATLATATRARELGIVDAVTLCGTPATGSAYLDDCARHFGVALDWQCGDDLGARMREALNVVLQNGRPALLIGSDCPVLTCKVIADAAEALRTHDVVLVPAEDGGYVLVGLARAVDCFSGVAWGTSVVMAETRRLLTLRGATWAELAPLWDVDTPDDLARWRALPESSAERQASSGGIFQRLRYR